MGQLTFPRESLGGRLAPFPELRWREWCSPRRLPLRFTLVGTAVLVAAAAAAAVAAVANEEAG